MVPDALPTFQLCAEISVYKTPPPPDWIHFLAISAAAIAPVAAPCDAFVGSGLVRVPFLLSHATTNVTAMHLGPPHVAAACIIGRSGLHSPGTGAIALHFASRTLTLTRSP